VLLVLTQVAALVNDINDASYTNMPASLARAYTMNAPKPMMPQPRIVQPIQRHISMTPGGLMSPAGLMSPSGMVSPVGQWQMFRPYVPMSQGARIPIVAAVASPGRDLHFIFKCCYIELFNRHELITIIVFR